MALLRTIWNDQSGAVMSVELVMVSVVGFLGLIVAYSSVRDAVCSELSDVAGSMQDTNLSFTINGLGGPSANVAGMGYFDGTDISDDPDDVSGLADNFMTMDVAPTNEPALEYVELIFGHDIDVPARHVDSWRSNMVIDEGQTFQSTAAGTVAAEILNFDFHAGRSGSVITPFVVKVIGDNDFEVIAVGDTTLVTATGQQSRSFSLAPTSIDIASDETIAFGFLDANPDGSGSVHSVVRFNYTTNEIWYSGGPGAGQSGSVSIGSAPTPGARTLLNQRRDYQFNIGLRVPQ